VPSAVTEDAHLGVCRGRTVERSERARSGGLQSAERQCQGNVARAHGQWLQAISYGGKSSAAARGSRLETIGGEFSAIHGRRVAIISSKISTLRFSRPVEKSLADQAKLRAKHSCLLKPEIKMWNTFRDRNEAGRLLGERLMEYADREDVLVLALPRGGVPVAFEVAQRIHAPLDVIVARKLGVPGHKEYAMGAIASGGVRVLNDEAISWYRISDEVIDHVAAREETELRRRELAYRGHRPPPAIAGKTVILVDDGIATGATMRAAARSIVEQHPAHLIIAVPTAPTSVYEEFAGEADEVIALRTPEPFRAVGAWYESFPQTSDTEVTRLLAEARAANFAG
jgi:putative phosphoribosyl transferase